jgi:hypothetical protein
VCLRPFGDKELPEHFKLDFGALQKYSEDTEFQNQARKGSVNSYRCCGGYFRFWARIVSFTLAQSNLKIKRQFTIEGMVSEADAIPSGDFALSRQAQGNA